MPETLPIDAFVPEIVARVRERRAAVITAAPGAGKTTRVPPALADDGRVLLLQPRRVAARAIATRIAEERGWTLGSEVGWHIRFDRRYQENTRLVVVTEGILTAMLQHDPLLTDVRTVVLDEFHERSVHLDLGLALVRQAWRARDDLRIVVMSATLDAAAVARFLDDCPIVEVPGSLFPVETVHRTGTTMEDAIVDACARTDGAILCFLPGAPEIWRAAERLGARLDSRVRVRPLHGSLDGGEQDAALRPGQGTRVILATNIAETTLTVPDVTTVIDSGLHKVARYDAERGIDSLDTERISRDSADQRAGRAGRVGPGRAVRLWDARDRLRAHREPEIRRVDLASVVLDVVSWGADPRAFEWFEAPPAGAIEAALLLLRQLGALDANGHVTSDGRTMQRLPLHPRLARLLIDSGGSPEAARACALLSERHASPPAAASTSSDLLSAIDRHRDLPPHVLAVARELEALASRVLTGGAARHADETSFRRAVLAAYPDRVARRRAAQSDRLLLMSGTGARLGRESGVHDAEFIVAVAVTSATATAGNPSGEAIVRMASAVAADWLTATSIDVEHTIDNDGMVRAAEVERYGAIELRRRHTSPEGERRAELLAAFIIRRGPSAEDQQLLRRLTFAGVAETFESLVVAAAASAARASDIHLESALDSGVRQDLNRRAPLDIPLPSGRRARLDYRDDGRVVAAVKLQELFGLAGSPRLANGASVTIELLAPSGRPIQVTTDLRSFWNGAYQQLRAQLRARYPRHPWPEDPWTAVPTHRTVRRPRP